MTCQRCDGCRGQTHHWLPVAGCAADFECKHCPALGDPCPECTWRVDDAHCERCHGEEVIEVSNRPGRMAYDACAASLLADDFDLHGVDACWPRFSNLPAPLQNAWQAAAIAAVRDWAETTFREAVNDDGKVTEWCLHLLKVGYDKSEPPLEVFRKALAGFVVHLIKPEVFGE